MGFSKTDTSALAKAARADAGKKIRDSAPEMNRAQNRAVRTNAAIRAQRFHTAGSNDS